MRVVVVGGGIAGLGTSLMLGRAGHRVTLLERDPAPSDDAEAAWESWERRGVPQSRLAHVFLGRMRNALRDEHPDVYAGLLDAGAYEISSYELMPASITDRSRRPADEDNVMLGVRRVVLELHLRRALGRTDGVEVRSSARVAGVIAGDAIVPGIPHVAGVTLDDGTAVEADLVVDCSGRRSALPQWIDAVGARPMPEEVVEDGLTYYGRYYRLEHGQSFPAHGPPLTDLGYLIALTFEADDGWFAIALAAHNEDKAMRALRDDATFEAALTAIPATAAWRTPGLARARTEVKTKSRIDDRWRSLVVDGTPVVTGLVGVGDSLVATNPAFGRGASLAWVAGRALVECVADHGHDPVSLANASAAETRRLLRGWFDQQVQMDTGRLEQMRRALAGEPLLEPDPTDPTVTFGIGLQLASLHDPEVYRAMGKITHLLAEPSDVLGDPQVVSAAIAAWENRAELTPTATGPTRAGLLDAMAVSEGSRAAAG